MRSLFLLICILGSVILFASLATAALTASAAVGTEPPTLLLLGVGLVVLGVYGKSRMKE